MKRFYASVAVEAAAAGGFAVLLDGKPIRTPARARLVLPSAGLAGAIAEEWAGQGERVQPRTMVLTGMANTVIDRIGQRRDEVAREIARYGENDLLCYRAEQPADLVRRQAQSWDPLLDWLRQRHGVELAVATGIVHRPQPPEGLAVLSRLVAAVDAWRLSPLHQFATLSGSLVIALALLEGALDVDDAFASAELDALYQAEYWGEDSEAADVRQARLAALRSAARFLALLG